MRIYLLFVFVVFPQGRCFLPNNWCAPQPSAHPDVTHSHDEPRQDVGQATEYHVVPIEKSTLSRTRLVFAFVSIKNLHENF